jgi:hypothetical protein
LTGAYRVEEVEEGKLYMEKHTKPHKREKWSRVVFEVKLADDTEFFSVNVDCSSTWACFAATLKVSTNYFGIVKKVIVFDFHDCAKK